MIWLQGAISFALWMLYGVWQTRRSDKVRSFARNRPRRGLTAAGLMLLGIVFLFVGLNVALLNGGFTENGMRLWAWAWITLCGFAFIHCQTLAMAIAVTMAQDTVTEDRLVASTERKGPETTDETPQA